MLKSIPIDQITRRADARALNEASVASLVDSIGSVGLINPIRVREKGGRWEVTAGSHRLAACERLGLADIECIVVSDDDLHSELAMIDENLCRNELSPAERAQQTARRKVIYEEMHPETKAGAAGAEARWNATDNLSIASFAVETAKATGKDERTVRRDAERGSKVIPEVIDMITGTRLDTGTFLDRLKKLSPNDQVTVTRRELSELRAVDRQSAAKARSAKIDADVKARAAKEVADIIAEHVPGEWWEAVKSNLYAAGAANIANALTNITGEAVMDRRAG